MINLYLYNLVQQKLNRQQRALIEGAIEVYEIWCVRIRDMVYTRLKYTIYDVCEI